MEEQCSQATNNTIDMWDWALWKYNYKWYEEGEIEHINGPTLPPGHGVFKLLKGRVGSIVGFFYTAK